MSEVRAKMNPKTECPNLSLDTYDFSKLRVNTGRVIPQ